MTSLSQPVSFGSSSSPSSSPSASARSPEARALSATSFGEPDQRSLAVATLVGTLRRTEALAGELFSSEGELLQATIAAEKAFGLSAVVSQAIVGSLGELTGQTSDVRAGLVAVHRRLEQLAKKLDIRMEDYGDGGKTPGFMGFYAVEDTAAIQA